MTTTTAICGLPTPLGVVGDGTDGACGRVAGHEGVCVDAKVIAKYGICPHGWTGPCRECNREQEGE